MQKALDINLNGLTPEECWAVVERFAESPRLARSARLKEFLLYVGSKSLKEHCTEVHEQEIGCNVFGRDDSYDTGQDNIVRVNATKLRERIDEYFKSEGAGESIVFEIPRGGYVPVFRRRDAAVALWPDTAASKIATIRTGRRLIPGLLAGVALLLAFACVFLWRENRELRTENESMSKELHAWMAQPALKSLWSSFLGPQQKTDIVLADTSFNLIQDLDHRPTSLSAYLNREYLSQSQTPQQPDHGIIRMLAGRANGSFGDFKVAQRIRALDYGSTGLGVEYARDYTVDQIKRGNVILIGSSRSNPWVDLFVNQMNFGIGYDDAAGVTYVTNRNPQSGEQSKYVADESQVPSDSYGVVAYLPATNRAMNVLIIEGTNSEATTAVGEFITSEASMESLLRRMNRKEFPYFEVLLKTTRLNGTPMNAEILAYRIFSSIKP